MDIVIGLVIIAGIAFYVFRNKKVVEEASSPAPYKIEAPVAPEVKVEVVNAQPVAKEEAKPAKVTKAPAKARAPRAAKPKAPSLKVVKAKAPRKPRAPKTPK
jgi:hypothetical protein